MIIFINTLSLLMFIRWLAPVGGDAIPGDFRLTAQYASPNFSWTTTIFADGSVLQIWSSPEVFEETGDFEQKRTLKISTRDIHDLIHAIDKSGFKSLPRELSKGGEDSQWYHIQLKINNVSYECYSLKPNNKKEQENKFYSLFTEILKKVPSPFPEQSAERYEPKKGDR